MKLAFSNSFQKVFKKLIRNDQKVEIKFWECVDIFIQNPFDKRLRTHKLLGRLNDLWSFSIDYDLRVVFYFLDDMEKAVFIDIGKHDEVY
jgi:mRNA-degrading endonuclease YafQ of YafQ-DinJ toxin-antitoxin module